ncbi:MAG: translocation/assembly module TamB domain-containing protein [Methylococcaceae bacterium]
MKKRSVFLMLIVMVLIIPVGLIGLISSEAGSRWLLRTVFAVLPVQVSVATTEGRLLDRLSLTDFSYQSDTESILIKHFAFTWQPARLFSGTLKIIDVAVNGLTMIVTAAKVPQEQSGFDLNAELLLPAQIVIENFLLTDMQFYHGDLVQKLEKLQLVLATEDDQLKIISLAVNAQALAATAQGQMTLGKGFPFKITSDWQLNAEQNGLWQGLTTITGDINTLSFDNRLSSPFIVNLKGHLDDLQTRPRITSRADWTNVVWPLAGTTPQIKSEQGSIEINGLLNAYQLTLNGQLTQQYLPEASVSFNGKGSQNSLSIEKLELKSKTGLFQVNGDLSWQASPAFDLTATGQNFNPAILLPELPGNLTFNTHVKGQLDAKALQLDAEINKLSGQLRGNPVSVSGKLALNGDQLKIDALRINSGANKIAVNGTLGQAQAELDLSIDAPALEALWPTLGGSLKGEGLVQGTWKNPTVKFQAQGKRVRFAEHSAGQLAITIDYAPEPQKTSKILLSASTLKTGAVQIKSVQIEGLGSLLQHRFKADMTSVYGDLSTALSGGFNTGNWKGDFLKLDLNNQELGLWQLKKNVAVSVSQQTSGLDITLDEACLVQKTASLCSHGSYLANTDVNVAIKALALPTKLMTAYLPEPVQLNGTLNADAQLQRQKNVLTGRYQFELSPATLLVQEKAIALGASSLSGNIKGDTLTADVDLHLAGQDYLRGQMQVNTGKSQAISGQLAASINKLGLLEMFAPQLSGTQGLLTADLTVKGSVKNPLIIGQIDLVKGTVNMTDSGFGIRDIDLHAVASGGQAKRLQINGALLPVLLKPENSPRQVRLNGLVTINADLRQQDGVLAGHYKIDSPPLTILSGSSAAPTQIALGASALSGSLNGDKVSADIDVKLVNQDYLRAQLQIDTGKTQTLSGQITASVVEFAVLNAYAPQLSNIKGQLNTHLTLQGTLKQPVASGAIRFTGGAVDINELGLALRDIKLQALALGDNNDTVQITGSAKSAEGIVNLDGFAHLQAQAGWPVELTLKGENFEIAKLPEAQIAISPDLKFVFAENKGKVSGTLKVPKALMTLKQLPENAVKVSPDEIILGEQKVKDKSPAAPAIDAYIDLELGKQVSFSGQGLATNLTGKLKITQTGEQLAMHGNIDMNKARYKSYGQDLTVRKGRFVFNGPADNPWLDVEAIRVSKSKKVTAILKLTGSLQKPETRISSEPALPESEALAYLITGGPLNQVSKSQGNMLAAAALSYGGGQAAWLTEKLGIDEFEVKEGETLQDTLVAVGQYLTPDFYVGAKVGLFNKQAGMVLKHKITDSINIETQAGTSQRVKINYEIDRN